MRLTTEIGNAIAQGFGNIARAEHGVKESKIYLDGYDEPIIVTSDPHDVLIPDALKAVAPGIMLDVQAILASR